MIILTDLSEVLVNGIDGMEKIISNRYGNAVAERFMERREETNSEFLNLLRGEFSEDCYWLDFLSEGLWPFNVYEIKRIFTENICRTVPGTLEVYKRIESYPVNFGPNHEINTGRPEIYIVSDHIIERVPQIKDLHKEVLLASSKQFWSCYIGLVKGDPEFFPQLLEKIKKEPEELLFIDDRRCNTLSATKAGIKSILFLNANQLQKEMIELGFSFKK